MYGEVNESQLMLERTFIRKEKQVNEKKGEKARYSTTD